MRQPLRILHISDLHISGKGAPTAPMDMKSFEQASQFLQERTDQKFLNGLRTRVLHDVPEDHWPKAVIVSGDVVDRGGTDPKELENAKEFLLALASLLQISPKRIMIVPGNHDVDWSRNLKQHDRFRPFFAHFEDFSTPRFADDQPTATWVYDLSNIRQGVKLEVLLMVSPTFSGIANPFERSFAQTLRRYLPDLPDAEIGQLIEKLDAQGGLLDIAAIGGRQLEAVSERRGAGDGVVRIAVLHHHLLPDPQVEIAQFEAVLDAGRVLEALLGNGFDLVLNGHKHNRRLVHYRRGQQMLDVYTAPSLFKNELGRPAGFTMIDIRGAEEPSYATLRYIEADTMKTYESVDLVRHGRVLPEVTRVCAEIPPLFQSSRLIPNLKASRDVARWSTNHVAESLIWQVWAQQGEDLRKLGDRRLVFRPPQLVAYWAELIKLAERAPAPTLRLVSYDDLPYWEEVVRPYPTDAKRYEAPISAFKGKKARVLILGKHVFENRDEARLANQVIDRMRIYGLSVMVFEAQSLPDNELRDFGIIGDLAVSRFIGTGPGDEARALEESFNEDDLKRAKDRWTYLVEHCHWSSDASAFDDSQLNFGDWLEQKHDLSIA